MSAPGVGALTSLAFVATVEDPQRFGKSLSIGSYIGLTPKRYQSGDRDVTAAIWSRAAAVLASRCVSSTKDRPPEAPGCLMVAPS
ncbi:transposase [Ensifer aridi]|uniref:transposase n=1 Tax=Ensifer aridi TaxID=1708715 RepID=UPI003B9688FC